MVRQRKPTSSFVEENTEQPVSVNGSPKKNADVSTVNGVIHHKQENELTLNGSISTTGEHKLKNSKAMTMKERREQVEEENGTCQLNQVASSLAVLLTQGLMANDAEKTDSVLKETKLESIQATLQDLQVCHVVPLLKAIEDRLRTRKATEIRPWIRWIQCIFSIHMPYLTSLRDLHKELGGLLEWMRARVGHQQKLLALHGKMSVITEQIERRTNRNVQVIPQPLIVFNNEDNIDSDLDDIESMGSDESGASSDEDWWDERGVKEDDDEDADDDDDDEEIDSDREDVVNKEKDGSESDGSGMEDGEEVSSGDDEDDVDDEMEIG